MNFLLAMSLILLVDVSGSVDDREYAIQKRGTVDALMDPSVQRAIWNQRGICIAYMEFHDYAVVVVDWTVVETKEEIDEFASRIASGSRVGSGSTNVFSGIDAAIDRFKDSPCSGDRVIDISGDGEQNVASGNNPDREGRVERINALPILDGVPSLADWYRENVVHNGFMMPVESFEDFPAAMKRKLAQEIAER